MNETLTNEELTEAVRALQSENEAQWERTRALERQVRILAERLEGDRRMMEGHVHQSPELLGPTSRPRLEPTSPFPPPRGT